MPKTRLLMLAAAIVAVCAVAPSVASAASPTYDLRGTWTVSGTNGGAASGTYDFTQMDMSTGAFSGSAVVSGIAFSVSGTESGSTATYDLTESSYTAHDTLPLSELPDGHVGGDGSFTDTNGSTGTFHAEQDAAFASKRASGTAVVCNLEEATGEYDCAGAVADASGQQPTDTPSGSLTFSAASGGFTGADTCGLTPATGGADCEVTYNPPSGGIPAGTPVPVSVSYSGDATFLPSEASDQTIAPSLIDDTQLEDSQASVCDSNADGSSGSAAAFRTMWVQAPLARPAISNSTQYDYKPSDSALDTAGKTVGKAVAGAQYCLSLIHI